MTGNGEGFLDLSIPAGHGVSTIATLGPAGTSSETAARKLIERLTQEGGKPALAVLHPTYETAAAAVAEGVADLVVVANAYAHIDQLYMNPALSLVGAFHHRTPDYGIAVDARRTTPAVMTVASHPAPTPLIDELMPDVHSLGEIIPASSTSAAAIAARSAQADAALTTRAAAEIYGLTFISETRPIEMLWSVFCSASRPGQPSRHDRVDGARPAAGPELMRT